MGWISSGIETFYSEDTIYENWWSTKEDLPSRTADSNYLTFGGTVETKKEAEKILNSKGFIGMMYVKVCKTSAKLRDARDLLEKEKKKLQDFIIESSVYKTHSGKTVGCKKCGSSFPVAYFLRNSDYEYPEILEAIGNTKYINCCPICLSEMRSDTALKRIDGYKKNISKYQDRVNALEKEVGTYYLAKTYAYCG